MITVLLRYSHDKFPNPILFNVTSSHAALSNVNTLHDYRYSTNRLKPGCTIYEAISVDTLNYRSDNTVKYFNMLKILVWRYNGGGV